MSPPGFLSPCWCGTGGRSPSPCSEHPQRPGGSIAAPTAELRGLEHPHGLSLSSNGTSQRGDMELDPGGAVPSLPPSPWSIPGVTLLRPRQSSGAWILGHPPPGLSPSSHGLFQRGDMDLDPGGAVPSLPPSPRLTEHPQHGDRKSVV